MKTTKMTTILVIGIYFMKIYNKIKLSDLYVNKIDSVEINIQNFNKQESKISASEADKY